MMGVCEGGERHGDGASGTVGWIWNFPCAFKAPQTVSCAGHVTPLRAGASSAAVCAACPAGSYSASPGQCRNPTTPSTPITGSSWQPEFQSLRAA